MIGILDRIIRYDNWMDWIGLDWMGDIGILDGIIGLDYWMVFFLPNSEGTRGPQGHSSQGRFFCCFYVILSKIVINGQQKLFLEQFF